MKEDALIRLPRLRGLQPSLFSTLLKGIEEAGELSREILKLYSQNEGEYPKTIQRISEELLDVAQTCVTMIFVLEDEFEIWSDDLVIQHLDKLRKKGYHFSEENDYRVVTDGNWKLLNLPQLDLPNVTLLLTVAKIQEELGELTQFLGKGTGASGESIDLQNPHAYENAALELLDIAQCCFTMMYLLADEHGIDLRDLVESHIAKLVARGYCEPYQI